MTTLCINNHGECVHQRLANSGFVTATKQPEKIALVKNFIEPSLTQYKPHLGLPRTWIIYPKTILKAGILGSELPLAMNALC